MQTIFQNRINAWSSKQPTQKFEFLFPRKSVERFPEGPRSLAWRYLARQPVKRDFATLMISWREASEERHFLRARRAQNTTCDKSIWGFSIFTEATTPPFVSELETEFAKLTQQWYRETAMFSMIHKKVMHPAYQRIIGMGKEALPLIFRELNKKRGHWLWALCAITGEDAATPGDNFLQAVDAWLRWGKQHGYLQ